MHFFNFYMVSSCCSGLVYHTEMLVDFVTYYCLENPVTFSPDLCRYHACKPLLGETRRYTSPHSLSVCIIHYIQLLWDKPYSVGEYDSLGTCNRLYPL